MVNTRTIKEGRVPRRSTSEIPILEPSSLDQILLKSVCKRDSCLIALLYLTGRRIGEVLPLRKQDFVISNFERVVFRTFNEKSFRSKRRTPFTIVRPEYPKRFYEQIEPEYSTQGPSGQILDHYVKSHLHDLKEEDYLFPPYRRSSRNYINQPRAYQILRSLDERLWLHAMRHIDFTRMAQVYQDDPVAMHRLTFHRRFESTLNYIKNVEKGDRLTKL